MTRGRNRPMVVDFILVYHQVVAYHWWLSFHPTKLDCYCKFEVSLLMRVMFFARLFIFLVLME
jgi:hypothetical protein